MKSNQFIVSIRQTSPRAAGWQKVFGRLDGIPVTGFFTSMVTVPEKGETSAYMLDLEAITSKEYDNLVEFLAIRFGLPADEVRKELWKGVPLLEEDVILSMRAVL